MLRLWHLSRQDLHTMLLLVQNVGPLDLVSSLVITLMWVPPVFLLGGHALGLLYVVSAPPGAPDSWLSRTVDRTPDWVLVVTAMWAAIAWELRFLPALAMVVLIILGLTMRQRYPERTLIIRSVCLALPLVVALATYLWFGQAIADAFVRGEVTLALLLLVPPPLTPMLTGPIPARFARAATHVPAATAALLGPFLLLAIFLQAPVLPWVALELNEPRQVVLGSVVTVDDTMTTLLDDEAKVRFVPNSSVVAKVLCEGSESVPYSTATAHGWPVEESALSWALPAKHPTGPDDPRCEGRPLLTPAAR
ncbi:hypothetical protein [Amycolatopsis sp. 195334CR]|uniref:hypothetical protein n=1 Tax=Amycolatopsis sp. 195334CR TaxID=2814588 RepID=UPI001A8F6522|nr:hypothetical protein [Amycolatopsis sp. 195334CR]MBN6034074.1 hypothetical protein [Amycolatopsis sp. 195334CR]